MMLGYCGINMAKMFIFINKKLFYKRFEKWNQLIFECKPFPIYMQSEGVY